MGKIKCIIELEERKDGTYIWEETPFSGKVAISLTKDQVAKLERYTPPTGYKDDKIFLLSREEYESYEHVIPEVNVECWLRDPIDNNNDDNDFDYFSKTIQTVAPSRVVHPSYEDTSNYTMYSVGWVNAYNAVRPVIKYVDLQVKHYSWSPDRFEFNNLPFRVIDHKQKLAISELPIMFDYFDEESSDYETSHIREVLNNWIEHGGFGYE